MSDRPHSARRRGAAAPWPPGAGAGAGRRAAGPPSTALVARAARHRRRDRRRGPHRSRRLRHHDVDVDDGGRIHVVERGQGPPVVLLHGFMLSSALWAHQLRDLADHHRVIALDLRGHGRRCRARRVLHGTERRGLVDELRADARMAAAQQGSPAMRRMAADVARRARGPRRRARRWWSATPWAAWWPCSSPTTPGRRAAPPRGRAWRSCPPRPGPSPRLPGFGGVARLAGPGLGARPAPRRAAGACALASRDLRWWLTRLGFGADAPPAQVRFVEGLHLATPSRTVADLLPVAGRSSTCRRGSGPSTSPCSSWWAPTTASRRPATPGASPPPCPTPSWWSCPAAGTCPCSNAATSSPG